MSFSLNGQQLWLCIWLDNIVVCSSIYSRKSFYGLLIWEFWKKYNTNNVLRYDIMFFTHGLTPDPYSEHGFTRILVSCSCLQWYEFMSFMSLKLFNLWEATYSCLHSCSCLFVLFAITNDVFRTMIEHANHNTNCKWTKRTTRNNCFYSSVFHSFFRL